MTLYLAPTLLSENSELYVLPPNVIKMIHSLRQFIVEDIRTARRFLAKIKHPIKIDDLKFKEYNEHTKEKETVDFLEYILEEDTAILSEAGVPCVADPGAAIVALAHQNNIKVVPLVGPSSLLLALMASGLDGQSFAFAGYLPIKRNERQEKLKNLERRSKKEQQTQIFIETPYRNMQLLEDLLTICCSLTKLTIASNITGKDEFIKTQTVGQWKQNLPKIHKSPTVFLMQA